MSKRILLTEWGVEPRVYGLDEFITAQTIDGFGNPLTPDEGHMLEAEIEQLNHLRVGETVRIGDSDCTEIYVERLHDHCEHCHLRTLNQCRCPLT